MVLEARWLQMRHSWRRCFSSSRLVPEFRKISELPDRITPQYREIQNQDLLGLVWPSPPRNILLLKKRLSPTVDEAFIEHLRYIQSRYKNASIVLLSQVAAELQGMLNGTIYVSEKQDRRLLAQKIDLVSSLGGDGTILKAASLFKDTPSVPPILSFSMGTLGFLGEWKFLEHKRAFREAYVSGAVEPMSESIVRTTSIDEASNNVPGHTPVSSTSWSSIRGKFMGHERNARVLLRSRLHVSIFGPDGSPVSTQDDVNTPADSYAMNEVIIHRGNDPHLAIVDIFVAGRFLTEAVADGLIVSTPTGSTAYSLSSGGSIVHPLVSSLLLTPICPRSLSFRPLVLPSNTPITLRLSDKNRGRKVEVSIDGMRMKEGMSVGMEIRVQGEDIRDERGKWIGGVPSIVRAFPGADAGSEDSWLGGLNSLLKFNYPMGEE